MNYIITPILGIIILLLNLITPILCLFVLPFIKWDEHPSLHPARTAGLPVTAIWGDLPKYLRWFQTPDQRFPGDLNIPEIRAMQESKGKYYTSYIWMAFRNPLMGLASWLGKQTSDYAPEGVIGMWKRTDEFGTIWKYTLKLGRLHIITGYNVYALLDGTFRAAPVFTAKIIS